MRQGLNLLALILGMKAYLTSFFLNALKKTYQIDKVSTYWWFARFVLPMFYPKNKKPHKLLVYRASLL